MNEETKEAIAEHAWGVVSFVALVLLVYVWVTHGGAIWWLFDLDWTWPF